MKKEQERIKRENDQNAEGKLRLLKDEHKREISDLKHKIIMLENDLNCEKEKRIEMEKEQRDSRLRKDLEDEGRREEQERESKVVEYKQNVGKQAEKQSWGSWAKSWFM